MKKQRVLFIITAIVVSFIICSISLSKIKIDEFIMEAAFDEYGNAYTLSYDNKNIYLKKINKDKKIEWVSKSQISNKDSRYMGIKEKLDIFKVDYKRYDFKNKKEINTPHNIMYSALYPVKNNNIYGTVAKVIYDYNGVIERYYNSGLISLYQNGSNDAIKCAIRIREKIKCSNDKMLNKADIGFVINKEEIMVGIIWGNNRISASVVSDYLYVVENLNDFGNKFGSSILVTENSMKELKDKKNQYNYRKLGNIKFKNKKESVMIYDFFDGDMNNIINLKKQTKEKFEIGVEYYLKKDFYNGRKSFIEVLKEDQEDKAAKEYLILCDKYYRIRDNKKIETYLEVF